jgi:acyl carrier protein
MGNTESTESKLQAILQGISTRLSFRSSRRQTDRADHRPDAAEIQLWLVTKLSDRLAIATDEMHVREPLANYGLDSRTALTLSGELEDWLGRKLSPTLLWDYPTIEDLAVYLGSASD